MKNIRAKVMEMECKVITKWNNFAADCSGSDTTEKIGMVLAAAVIIGLLMFAVRTYMPAVFQTLISKAQTIIEQNATVPTP